MNCISFFFLELITLQFLLHKTNYVIDYMKILNYN